MKILISAFACDPYLGSESGVGWTAVCRIARQHDVWVIADFGNKAGWERGYREGIIPSNVKLRALGEGRPFSNNRFIARMQSWLNYISFNRQVLRAAREWHEEVGFDLCHQVTIAAWRLPSPLWQLPIPFIWGPIGGAGYISPVFRKMLSPTARLFEFVRDLQTAFACRSRAFRKCISETAVVIAANEETEVFLKPYRAEKVMIRLPVASLPEEKIIAFKRAEGSLRSGPLRLFAGGNMEGRKGLSLAVRALAQVAAAEIDFRYMIAGGGPDIANINALVRKLGISDKVEFHPGFSGKAYIEELQKSDIYFLPSFRETTPVTLLEAYLAGCYPVIADTGAQGEIVRLAGGYAVPAKNLEGLITGLADRIIWCNHHRNELPELTAASAKRAAEYFNSEKFDVVIENIYQSLVSKKT
jgi:glycosyltransferase involved in cell wall biosynthesis